MRRERFVKRLLALVLVVSMVAAWAIPARAADTKEVSFTQVDNSAVSAGLPDRDQVTERPDTLDYDADEVVRVSIVLEKKGTIEAGYDIESIAWNRAAVSYREGLEALQNSLVAKINRAIQGQLDVVWNLTLAANIISANVEYGEIAKIKEISGVKDVVVETCYEPAVVSKADADPNMATSSKQIGSSTAWASGYTGAGSRIAIIDSGVDYEHLSFDGGALEYSLAQIAAKAGMSTEDYIDSLDLLDAAEIASVADQLNVSIDADAAYVSTKIPFGYNYVDENYNITHLRDTQTEHGSHVAGIATANTYVPDGDGYSSALDSVLAQGVAPDAQLIAMKVFGENGGAYDSDYMAAIEDAIVLGADSINLSLGSGNPGMSSNSTAAYQEILDNLVHSGVVVTMSTGNSGSWVENAYNLGYLYSDDVSMDTAGSPGSYTNSLGVASVDNDGFTGAYLSVDGTMIFYTETSYKNDPMTSVAGEREYVLIDGYGTEEEWAAVGDTLAGKIAICSRGSIAFYQKAENAVAAGAIATIIYNNTAGTINMDLSDYTQTAPCVSVLQSDGDTLRAAATPVTDDEGNVLYYTGIMTVGESLATTQYDSDYYTMSSFSSWGVPGSLELKPEITAPGGSIYSVNGAHAGDGAISDHDAYENMSGTSMAAPQVTGMAAVLAQYIRENGLEEKTGLDARTLAQSLLMSTAEPMLDGETGYYYSVLQQGSGLANVGNAVTADSYILMNADATDSYADGKVKAELGDDPDRTGVYSFSFTINNLTDVDKTYTLSADFFTQDLFRYYANGNYSLDELALYMDTWTAALAANVSWTVDGKPVKADADLTGMDFNGDGTVNASDGQALLDYATGVIDDLHNIAAADQDGDGDIDSYDAYLFLSTLTSGTVQVPADGSVTVCITAALTEDEKAYLDTYYEAGAYIEGYVYVTGVSSAEGVEGTTHSIPVLGFYGNWSDPSMFEVGSYLEYAHGEEYRLPYLGSTKRNALTVIYGDDPSSEYFFGGNPVVWDETYMPERNAINSNSQIGSMFFSVIRNAAASMFTVSNETTGQLLIGQELGQIYSAYYYVNGASWQKTGYSLNLGLSPADLAGYASEGDTLEIGLTLAPEYYVDSEGNVDWNALGEGATFSIPMVIDDTDPYLFFVCMNPLDNTLEVFAADNQYVAGVALFDEFGTYLYTYQGAKADAEAGDICRYTLDLADVNGAKFLLQVYDYAMNTTTYEIWWQIGEVTDTIESVDISSESIVLAKGSSTKLTASVLPVNATDRSITWTSSDETVATVDENGVVTAVDVGNCVITAASAKDPTVAAECSVTVFEVNSTLEGVLQDEDGNPMFFSWNLKESDTWTGGIGLDTNIASAAVDVHTGQLYIQDASNAAMHKIDAATGESLEISGSCAFGAAMSDMASVGYYSSEDAPLLVGVYAGYFLAPTDPMENTFNRGWNLSNYLSNYTGASKFVAIAFYGAYQDDDGIIYDEFLALDDAGYLWILDYCVDEEGPGLSLGFIPTTLNATFAEYGGNQYSSMVADENGDLYLSAFDGSTNVVYYMTYNGDSGMFDAIRIGDFGADVWPAALTVASVNGESDAEAASAASYANVMMTAENLQAVTLPTAQGTAVAGGLNSTATVSKADDARPLSSDLVAEDGKTVTVTVTAKDLEGSDVDATNGIATVTYDPEKLELVSVTVHAGYRSVKETAGEVTFGYVELDGIAAGDTVATLVFAVKDGSKTAIVIDHEEVNDAASGYQEVLFVGSDPEPTDPEPTDPEPTDPEPTDPEPTDPEPTDPEPTDPEPTDPEPTDPEPTDPEPTDPEPTDPEPTDPEPTDPEPTDPEPTDPEPTDPEPTDPEPTDPEPTDPEPTDPEPIKPDGPSTGDNGFAIWLVALLVSAFGIIAVVGYKRKFF